MSDEKFELEPGRVMAVITESEMDRAGVELSGKARLKVAATVGGGILTKYDVRNIVKRWVSAGCPDAIKHNETADRMRQNAVNKEQEHIRVCGELQDVREKGYLLGLQTDELKTEIQTLKNVREALISEKERLAADRDKQERRATDLNESKRDLAKQLAVAESHSEQVDGQLQMQKKVNEDILTASDKLHQFIGLFKNESFFKKLKLVLSDNYFSEVYKEITR